MTRQMLEPSWPMKKLTFTSPADRTVCETSRPTPPNLELGGRLIYHVNVEPVNEKLNNSGLWKSLLTSPHCVAKRAICFNEDKDDSPAKRLKSGILKPLGYLNFST
ncbi:hypothetical protein ACFX19_047055 [Malus domestica]